MKNFLYLIAGLLLISGQLYSQSYGLQFFSHESIPEKRTSLNLTPREPLCLNEDTQISFDLKFVPGLNAYFGYVTRLITTDNQNIDIVSVDKFGNFNFVIGESFSYSFKIDSSSLFGKWNHFEIRFDKTLKEVNFFLDNRLVTKGKLNFTNATCCKVFFGTSNLQRNKTIDVPPMHLKDIDIVQNKKRKYFFPLSETTGNTALDIVEKKVAEIKNPLWIAPRHLHWKQLQTVETTATPSVAFDKKNEILYIVSVDTLYKFSFKTNQLSGSKLSKSRQALPAGNQSIFDDRFNTLYNLFIDEKTVSAYDAAENSWKLNFSVKPKLTEFWQANKFISNVDSALYIIGGYGQLKYKNLVQRFSFRDNTWEVLQSKGDFFMPRYLSALGTNAATDTAYIIGGYGSKTGDQTVNPTYNFELMAYSVAGRSFKHIYNFKQPEKEFCFANSLIIDGEANQFYGLTFPIDRYNSHLQLIRGSLSSPEYEFLGDSIPYAFHDIESFADLYYCPSSKKLVAVTLVSSTNKPTSVKIFTIDFPPNRLIVTQPVNASDKSMYLLFAILFSSILLLSTIFILKRKRKQTQQPVTDTSVPILQSQQAFQSLAAEDSLSSRGLYENATTSSSIFLFGNFEVIDKEGNNITRQFTPLLKEIFLLILINTHKDGKGISSDKLYETIWVDKPIKDARNNFSVNIVKLKSILEKVGVTNISKETGKWRFEIVNNSIKLDYQQFLNLADDKPTVVDKNYINELLAMVNKGAFLREAQYSWLDDTKANVSDFVISAILNYTSNASLQSEPDFILKLANCIFQFDQMSEEALELKCRSLIILGRHGLAKETFLNFLKEYKKNYGQDFEKTYAEIIGQH
jgi:two-component SAPR family response regulator